MLPLLAGAGFSSCAYYNGLYNARQLAREAGVAEREGRRGEARSLWTQVAVKAESVAVKYPDSKYHDDALLMQGFALSQIAECQSAVIPLAVAVSISDDEELITESRFQLAACWLELGDPETARDVLDPLAHLVDSSVQSRRTLLLGRAALIAGEPGGALPVLNASAEPEARYERAVALLALGRIREAASVIDSTRREPYFEDRWKVTLNSIGAVDHRVASALVDRLREDGDLTGGQEARLLIADGNRWQREDEARARTRFLQAAEVAGDSLEAALALGHLTVLEFRRDGDLAELDRYRQAFQAILADGGAAVEFVRPFALVVTDVLVELEEGAGPLRLFRRAEDVREKLGALPMAAGLFRTVVDRFPNSVFTPKAMLAVAALQPAAADSIRRVLQADYRDSPYTQIVSGWPAPGYTALEDSLRRLLDELGSAGVSDAGPAIRGLPGSLLADTARSGAR